MTLPPPAPSRCPRCGGAFACGIASGACWCAQLPALREPPAGLGAACLCPACLRELLETQSLAERVDARIASKTMPAGALAPLMEVARRLALLQGTERPSAERAAMLVFAADHGVADEGVSAYPREVTRQMTANILAGGAAVSVIARANGLALRVVDAGVDHGPQPDDTGTGADDTGTAAAGAGPAVRGGPDAPPGLVRASMGRGTRNLAREPAMSEADAREAMRRGADAFDALAADTGCEVVGLGEMGIGNSTAAAALTARLLGLAPEDCVGRGTGLDDARLARKVDVVRRALALHADAASPEAALAALGGFEIAMMAGAIEAAVRARRLVVVDGFIATSALLVAWRRDPSVLRGCVFAHESAEPGHRLALRALGARPLLTLGLRLGEGSGAALAMPLVRASARLLSEMASFESAGVSAGVTAC
jgi:nicotinate-nucleotide--dimethylbenzimidazole phosphoribosyltransferase